MEHGVSTHCSMGGHKVMLVLLVIGLALVGANPSVQEYKATPNLGDPSISVVSFTNPQQARDECLEALNNLANLWHLPNTRIIKLVKLSYAFRLQDGPPKPPRPLV